MGKHVACLRLRVTPLRDMVLPPASSKVLKDVLLTRGGLLAKLLQGSGFRRISVSMLYRGRRPLYSTKSMSKPLSVREGEPLQARICIVGCFEEVQEFMWDQVSGRFETNYGPVAIEPLEAEVTSETGLSLGGATGLVKIVFRTPAILSNKILLCLNPEKRIPLMHRLLPSPGLLLAYLVKEWNNLMDEKIYVRGGQSDPCIIARAAEVYMAEVDYDLKPVTVVVGRDPKGRLRTPRAVVGWVVYRVVSRKLASILDKTLALASRIGVGRSRAIGYGELEAYWLKPQSAKPSPHP